jgi:hypothetical protein
MGGATYIEAGMVGGQSICLCVDWTGLDMAWMGPASTDPLRWWAPGPELIFGLTPVKLKNRGRRGCKSTYAMSMNSNNARFKGIDEWRMSVEGSSRSLLEGMKAGRGGLREGRGRPGGASGAGGSGQTGRRLDGQWYAGTCGILHGGGVIGKIVEGVRRPAWAPGTPAVRPGHRAACETDSARAQAQGRGNTYIYVGTGHGLDGSSLGTHP